MIGGAKVLLFGGQGQQTQLVGQGGLAQSQASGCFGLGAAPQPDHLLDAPGGVKGVQLAALQILQQSQRRRLTVVVVGQDGGDLFQLGQAAGTQPPLPGHQLIFAQPHPPHADRLQQSVL